MSQRQVHCWYGEEEHIEKTQGYDAWLDHTVACLSGEKVSATCMLPRGHAGPHEFTLDDQIGVSFEPPPRK